MLAIVTVARIVRILELVNTLGGEEEEYITNKDNKMNGILFIIFMVIGFAFMIYFTIDAKKYLLPVPATKHGLLTDNYLNMNFALIIVVFFITQILLFYYAFRYRHKKGAKAFFYPVNHKLEFIWTIVPAIVLFGLIIYGLKLWNDITKPAPKGSMVIEIYGKQFDWSARYAGGDNILGRSNFKLITDDNPLGVDVNDPHSKDDKVALNKEIHFPVGVPIILKFHSRDVIHSAYFPHLRTQMNCVPGMTTEFFMETTITTDSMRKITNNPKFDYVLLCNKICGVAHYTMHLKIVIDTQQDFMKWYKDQPYALDAVEATAASQDTLKKVALK